MIAKDIRILFQDEQDCELGLFSNDGYFHQRVVMEGAYVLALPWLDQSFPTPASSTSLVGLHSLPPRQLHLHRRTWIQLGSGIMYEVHHCCCRLQSEESCYT